MAFSNPVRLWAMTSGAFGWGMSMCALAQVPSYTPPSYSYSSSYPPAPPVTGAEIGPSAAYDASQLDQMLGPIALYPDPLLSEILAAATYPQDVAAAGQLLQYDPTPAEADIDAQSWDPSVKALAHYPQVVQMMAGQMDWTEALGTAFANQPQDVMDSVQRLRAAAVAARTLATTAQQEVVNDNGVIEILPAQPSVIYVPEYDPGVVYSTPAYAGTWITFGDPCATGLWLDLDWDWRAHRINRGVRWDRDWHHPDLRQVQVWQHDRRRPIPAPQHRFVPPRNNDVGRGRVDTRRAPGVFNPGLPARTPPGPARVPERPVTGLPKIPERPAPAPRVPERPVEPRPVPVTPRRPIEPRVAPQPVERPVVGLPQRVAPTPPRVEPVRPVEPRIAPTPAPPPRAAPAFHPGGGDAASSRGHSSMRR
jgi:hypothetical protein